MADRVHAAQRNLYWKDVADYRDGGVRGAAGLGTRSLDHTLSARAGGARAVRSPRFHRAFHGPIRAPYVHRGSAEASCGSAHRANSTQGAHIC